VVSLRVFAGKARQLQVQLVHEAAGPTIAQRERGWAPGHPDGHLKSTTVANFHIVIIITIFYVAITLTMRSMDRPPGFVFFNLQTVCPLKAGIAEGKIGVQGSQEQDRGTASATKSYSRGT